MSRRWSEGRKEGRELLTLLPEAKEIRTEPVSTELRSSISRENKESNHRVWSSIVIYWKRRKLTTSESLTQTCRDNDYLRDSRPLRVRIDYCLYIGSRQADRKG